MTDFTEGPWEIYGDWGIQEKAGQDGQGIIATFESEILDNGVNRGLANAHLITSTPDMYYEIENDIDYFKCSLIDAETLGEERSIQGIIDRKESLLKKARGE